MTDYKRFHTPYEAFVHRAWKASLLTGTEQYILISKDPSAAVPDWVEAQPHFLLTASSIPSPAPFSALSGSFCDLNTLPAELSKPEFAAALDAITPLIPTGSTLVFSYRCDQYSYREMEQLLSSNGYLIYEHVSEEEIRDQFLLILATRRPKISVKNHAYCLAVKHREIKK